MQRLTGAVSISTVTLKHMDAYTFKGLETDNGGSPCWKTDALRYPLNIISLMPLRDRLNAILWQVLRCGRWRPVLA